jgi:hypothetical protein
VANKGLDPGSHDAPPRHAYPHEFAAAALEALRRRQEPVTESPLLAPALFESLLSTA